jgi:hypothetical protein
MKNKQEEIIHIVSIIWVNISSRKCEIIQYLTVDIYCDAFRSTWVHPRFLVRGNQNPKSKKNRQTTQWPKEKVHKDKQRSTKHTHKTKDRVTRTPLKSGDELRCSGRVSSSCSTSGWPPIRTSVWFTTTVWRRLVRMVPTVGWKIQIYIVRAFKLEKVLHIWLSNYFGFLAK